MSSILVTGGAGFIGSTLCERLIKLGHKVVNYDNFNDFYSPSIKKNNISKIKRDQNYVCIEGDIRDSFLLETTFKLFEIDKIIHLAAMAGVRKSIESPLEYIDVDIGGTVNLLELSKKYNIKKFIFASSSSVYGKNPIPFRENDYIDLQISPYAAAKHSGELYCKTYNELYKIPIICLRFFTVYGPRQRPEMAIHSFTRLIDEGKEIPIYGDGKSSRDYTYIDDAVDGILSALDTVCSFEIINIGNSCPIAINKIINLIEEKLDKPALKRYIKPQPGDVFHTLADISKAQALLGYEPKTSIDEGLDKFISWYKNK